MTQISQNAANIRSIFLLIIYLGWFGSLPIVLFGSPDVTTFKLAFLLMYSVALIVILIGSDPK